MTAPDALLTLDEAAQLIPGADAGVVGSNPTTPTRFLAPPEPYRQ